ncbi:MAG: hypothetical protein ACT6UH_17125 [Hydrogenophaga sp.]|uniref:hypothetical protein n=1 Tax=Hydrogenophaga sp. TaxID=1904254 RepID=UPI0040367761
MNQTPSHAAEPFEAMPFAKEIRASAKYSAELRRQVDQLLLLVREPLMSEEQTKDRLEALKIWRAQLPPSSPAGAVQKTVASSGKSRQLLSSTLI